MRNMPIFALRHIMYSFYRIPVYIFVDDIRVNEIFSLPFICEILLLMFSKLHHKTKNYL